MKQNWIMIGTFVTLFANTAIITILVDANFTQSGIPITLVQGSNPDFTAQWYELVGSAIENTMIINAFYPIITVSWLFSKYYYSRIKDRGCKCQHKYSSSLTIQEYVMAHIGAGFSIDGRYSVLLRLIFVTLMYGTGMPLMYPIALLTCVVIYVVDRYCLLYFN